jgi:peptidyl-prolyl cis-trans isomerase C
MSIRTNERVHGAALTVALLLSGCSKDDTVVKIGTRRVDQEEFSAYLAHRHIASEDPKRLAGALDEYAERAALASAIERERKLDPLKVKVELDEMKKELLIGRYFEDFLADRVGDDAVRNYYESHAREYEQRKVHVAHVLVRTASSMDEAERKSRLTRIQEADSKLRAGSEFAEVAGTYSEDRISAPRGGDLGWIKEGALDAQISSRAFKLKPGEVSEPFLSQYGFHILKVLEGPQEVKTPFEAVAGDIRYQLRQKAKEAERKRLEAMVKVEKKPDALQRMVSQSAGAKGQKLSAK